LAESEITIIKKLAARLGFSSDFFEETISHLLENKYITEEPIKFSNQEIAKSFLEDGLKLALSDEITTEKEMSWLRDTANENGIGEAWFNKKFKELQNKSYIIGKSDFALFSII
ncbi:MAG: hypothetical protein OQJ93_03760, partial [Ignavibacteriaceae bacterium]|nr:hypothetical protein [Ignavibacteriaceae bacterium]